jgi:hypothetical protein
MEFQKIQLTKQNTLTVTYKNGDGDVINFTGANIVHKDLKDAMNALVPHLSIITEQREAYNRTLKEVQGDRITDEGIKSVYKRFTVDTVTFSNSERKVSLSGVRLLTTVGLVQLSTPQIDTDEDENYQYHNELAIDVEAVKYEAKEYIEQRKWGMKEASIEFKDVDPFKVKADDAPEAETKPKKRGRKSKVA